MNETLGMVEVLMKYVNKLKETDKEFAKDFEPRKKELAEFAVLFWNECKKCKGGDAGWAWDENVQNALVHYFSEPKGSVKTLDIGAVAVKKPTDKPTPPTPSDKTNKTKSSTPKSSAPVETAPVVDLEIPDDEDDDVLDSAPNVVSIAPASPAPSVNEDVDEDDDEELLDLGF